MYSYKFNYTIAIYLVLLLFWGCSPDEISDPYIYPKTNALNYTQTHTLVENELKTILLDKSNSIDYSSLQLLQVSEERAYLSLFDQSGPRWYLYDYESGEMIKHISFALEGPNGVGTNTMSMGCFLYSPDTLLIQNYWNNELMIFNSKGEKQSTIVLPAPDEGHFSAMLAQAPAFGHSPYVFLPNIYQGIIGDQLIPSNKIPVFLMLNIRDGSTRYLGRRSGIYDQGYHVAGTNSMVFGDYNGHLNQVVYSFRQDHTVYLSDHNGRVKIHPVGSEFFQDIEPLSEDFREGLEQEVSGAPMVGEYIRTMPKYGRILYDPWRNVYYRFTNLPRNKEEYLANPYQIKPSVIIINAEFLKIGEVKMDIDQLYSSAKLYDAFVSKEGLMIPWKSETSEDEFKLMTFELRGL